MALVWNVGTLHVMLRENLISEIHEGGSIEAHEGGGAARSSVEVSVMEMERRGCIDRLYNLVNHNGRSL